MTRLAKGLLLALLCALLAATLSGCAFNASAEEMYTPPQLPAEYTELQTQIDAILAGGAEYAAPTSGTNIQSVQMVDLDGDAVEEAVAFFRNSADQKPLKIHIFRAVGDSYEEAALIESSGTSIYSIQYIDMDGNGVREIVVGWRVSPEILAVGVYDISNYQPEPLMFSLYTRYEVLDFDEDGMLELVLLRSNDQGEPVAEYYDWAGRAMEIQSTARISMTMAELQGMEIGQLRDGEPALFVTGVAEETRAITDILAYRQESMINIVRNDVTGVSSEISRYVSLAPEDINGDGVTEVPMPVALGTSADTGETYWQIYWRNYNIRGQGETVAMTYHNISEGWYLLLPDSWDRAISIRQSDGAEEQGTVFSIANEDGTYTDLVVIYSITGGTREYRATRNGRFVLQRQVNTVYAAYIYENSGSPLAITQEELSQRFRLVAKEWSTEEN